MKKLLLVAFAVILPFALSGCIPSIIKASADRDQVFIDGKLAAIEAQKPIIEITARPGQDIVLSGVESFTVWGNTAGPDAITQRRSQFWDWMANNSGIVGMLTFSWLMFPNGVSDSFKVVDPVQMPTQVIDQPTVIFAPQ
jgi:hypothetical protein